MVLISSSPNSPPSPACGFKPATAILARGKPRSRQDLRGEFDGERDFFRRQFFGNGFDGNVNGGQRDAQPAAAFVRAEQHHRGAFGAGEFGEKFRLADKFVAGADDGFLVDRRGDERVEFAAQAALAAVAQRSDGRRWRRAANRRADFPAAIPASGLTIKNLPPSS